MFEWIKSLLLVQEIDINSRVLREKVAAVPVVISSLNEDVARLEQDEKNLINELRDLEVRLKKLEIDAETEEKHAFKLKAQSPMVKNKDEYRAMINEMEFSQQKASDLENQAVELMLEIEEKSENLDQFKKDVVEEKKRIAAKISDLSAKNESFKAEIDELQSRRPAITETVPQKTLDLYERIRKSKKDKLLAVAELNEEYKCGSCHLSNNHETKISIMKEKTVLCSNCSAILYLQD